MDTRILKLTKRDENGRRYLLLTLGRDPSVTSRLRATSSGLKGQFPITYENFNGDKLNIAHMFPPKRALRGWFESRPLMLDALLHNGGVVVR